MSEAGKGEGVRANSHPDEKSGISSLKGKKTQKHKGGRPLWEDGGRVKKSEGKVQRREAKGGV